MNNDQVQILEHQKNTWNKFAPGWKKWDEFTMNFLRPMGEAIIKAISPKEGEMVLDIATGTGEPGLTIAKMVGNGKVIGTDISDEMLAIAKENANKKGITNYSVQNCDVSELPFADNTFDAVSCRMGFMFFPDMQKAAQEMVRVLKPGGRLATSVWGGPETNPWITSMMQSITKYMEMPTPPPGAPGMFRCAAPGFLANMFKEAGLKNVDEKEVKGRLDYGSPDGYWTNMNDIAAPVVNALGKATEEQKANIKKEVFSRLEQQSQNGKLELDFSAWVISGVK